MSVASSVANEKLTQLRMKKKQAIQSLNFDAAEEYDRQIAETNEFILRSRVEKINEEAVKEVNDVYIRNEETVRNIETYQKKQEQIIKTNFAEMNERARRQGDKEARNIDKAHQTALLREAEAEVPEQMDKLEEAKELASKGEYQAAKNMMAEARLVGERTLAERKDRIDREFSQSLTILATKQQEEMDRIEQMYDQEMEKVIQDVNIKREEAEERYQSGIELIIERGTIKCRALLADDQFKEDAVFQLKQRVNDTLIALDNGTSLPYPKKLASSSARSGRSSARSGRLSSRSSSRSKHSISSTRATGKGSFFGTPRSNDNLSISPNTQTPTETLSPSLKNPSQQIYDSVTK